MPESPNQSFFEAHRNEIFQVQNGPALELVECTTLPQNMQHGQRESFSLVFRGPVTPRLPQATYFLAPPESEPMAIFLVPVGMDANGVLYQAVFN